MLKAVNAAVTSIADGKPYPKVRLSFSDREAFTKNLRITADEQTYATNLEFYLINQPRTS